MSDLAQLQVQFATALLEGGNETPNLFCTEPQQLTRRFNLYRGNLTANWKNSLETAYPVIKQLVGDEFFRAMSREFGRTKPTTQGDLNLFGDGFSEFIAAFTPLQAYPYMADVARLEWLLHLAHYAADSSPIEIRTFFTLDLESAESLQLELLNGSALFQSLWDVVGIWQAHQPGSTKFPDVINRPSRCLVYRPRWQSELLTVSQSEFVVLKQINLGIRLGDALEKAFDVEPDFDPGTVFPRWLQAGIFASLKTNEKGDNQ